MLNLLDLHDDLFEARHESFGVVVVEDVKIDALITAGKEGLVVSFCFDASTDRSQHKCSRIYSLEVSSGHLQYYRIRGRHHCDNLRSSFDASTSFVFLWLVCRYLKLYRILAS